ALIRKGKNLPHGIRPIRLLRYRVPGVHGEAQNGQNPHAASAPAEIVAGVEGCRSSLALGIGRVEELLLGVLQPALDSPQALGGVAPLRFLRGLGSWSIRHVGVLLWLLWCIRVMPGHLVAFCRGQAGATAANPRQSLRAL